MINPLAIALLLAQAAPPAAEPPADQLRGRVDVFYGLNTNRPADGSNFLPGTGTTARRANELNLNAAAVGVSLEPRPVGFHLTLGFGSGLDVVHTADPSGAAIALAALRRSHCGGEGDFVAVPGRVRRSRAAGSTAGRRSLARRWAVRAHRLAPARRAGVARGVLRRRGRILLRRFAGALRRNGHA